MSEKDQQILIYEEDVLLIKSLAEALGLANLDKGDVVCVNEEFVPPDHGAWTPPDIHVLDNANTFVRIIPRFVWDSDATLWLINHMCEKYKLFFTMGMRDVKSGNATLGFECGAIFQEAAGMGNPRRLSEHPQRAKAWRLAVCRAALLWLQAQAEGE